MTDLSKSASPENEKQFAIRLANKVLDRISGDPDDDLAVLSRQFLRSLELKSASPSEPRTIDAETLYDSLVRDFGNLDARDVGIHRLKLSLQRMNKAETALIILDLVYQNTPAAEIKKCIPPDHFAEIVEAHRYAEKVMDNREKLPAPTMQSFAKEMVEYDFEPSLELDKDQIRRRPRIPYPGSYFTKEQVEALHQESAEPRRDEREVWIAPSAIDLARRFHTLYESMALDFGYKTREESAKPWSQVPTANQELMIAVCNQIIAEFWAARASAAPLKQTAEIRNQVLEEAALETLSFLEEVPAEKWPPFGLCPERNRAGDSAETARNIAGAIRKLKSAASLPQPSAGREWLLNKLKKGERDFRDQSSSNFPGSKISLYFAQLLELYKTDFGAPSAGQTEVESNG